MMFGQNWHNPKDFFLNFRGIKSKNLFLQHSHKVYAEVCLAVMRGCTCLSTAFSFILKEEFSIPE